VDRLTQSKSDPRTGVASMSTLQTDGAWYTAKR